RQTLVAEGEDEQLIVERNQVGPAVGLTRGVRNQRPLLAEELEAGLQAAHRTRRALDEEGDVLERGLGRLGGIAGGEADGGAPQEGGRHLDPELLRPSPESPSAPGYTGCSRFRGTPP